MVCSLGGAGENLCHRVTSPYARWQMTALFSLVILCIVWIFKCTYSLFAWVCACKSEGAYLLVWTWDFQQSCHWAPNELNSFIPKVPSTFDNHVLTIKEIENLIVNITTSKFAVTALILYIPDECNFCFEMNCVFGAKRRAHMSEIVQWCIRGGLLWNLAVMAWRHDKQGVVWLVDLKGFEEMMGSWA